MSFFPLREPLQGGLSVERAEVIVAPRDKREWFKLQLLNINITNFTLIFTVLALAISINHTLDSQRRENERAEHALLELRQGVPAAVDAVSWIKNSSDIVEHFKNISTYGQQLEAAQQQIVELRQQLLNVTQQLQAQMARPTDSLHYVGDAATPFANGWGVKAGTSPPRFWKDRGVVHLEGVIAGGDSKHAMFYLPEGYRPHVSGTNGPKFIVIDNGAATGASPAGMGEVIVYDSGAVAYALDPASLGRDAWINLDGISFAVDQDFA
jgi:hypothetical protein